MRCKKNQQPSSVTNQGAPTRTHEIRLSGASYSASAWCARTLAGVGGQEKKRFIFFQHENTASLSAAPRQANPGGEKKDKKTEKSTMRLQSVSMRHEGCAICCCCLLLLLLLLSCSSLRMFGSRTARTVFANYVICVPVPNFLSALLATLCSVPARVHAAKLSKQWRALALVHTALAPHPIVCTVIVASLILGWIFEWNSGRKTPTCERILAIADRAKAGTMGRAGGTKTFIVTHC